MPIKDSKACLAQVFTPCSILHYFGPEQDLESEAHLQMSGGLRICPLKRKTTEMKGASSTDQVLLWGVGLLHSLIIVISCLVMTQSSSGESLSRLYDGDSECVNGLLETVFFQHFFSLKEELRL